MLGLCHPAEHCGFSSPLQPLSFQCLPFYIPLIYTFHQTHLLYTSPEAAQAAVKRARFDNALDKSNWASQALKQGETGGALAAAAAAKAAVAVPRGTGVPDMEGGPTSGQAPAAAGGGGGTWGMGDMGKEDGEEEEIGDEADRDLQRSLERARRLAQQQRQVG